MTDTATPTSSPAPPPPSPAPTPPPARPFPLFPYLLLALVSACVLAAGLMLAFWMNKLDDSGTVSEIRITARNTIDPQKFEEVLDTPDYFLALLTDQGSIRTKPFDDTRVGSGLTFKLPVPVPLFAIKELQVWDHDTFGKDKQMDRVDKLAREVDGEKFHFSLQGQIPPRSNERKVGLALAICGGAILLLTFLKFLRAQVL